MNFVFLPIICRLRKRREEAWRRRGGERTQDSETSTTRVQRA